MRLRDAGRLKAGRGRTALSGGALYAGVSALESALFLLLLPFITRSVTPKAFAQFAILRIGIGILYWLSDAGTGQAAVRYVAESADPARRNPIVGTLLWCRLPVGMLASAVAWLLLRWLGPGFLGAEELAEVLPVTAAAVLATTLLGALTGGFRAEERHGLTAGAWAIRGVAAAAGYVVFVLMERRGLVGLMLGLTLGETMGLLASLPFALPALRAGASREVLRTLLSYGVPAAISVMSPVFASLDRYVVQRLNGTETAGFYHLAAGPAFAIDLLRRAATNAIEPYFFGVQPLDAPVAIARLVRRYSFLMLAAALVLSSFAPEIIAVLAPKEYASAIVAVPPLAFAAFCDAAFGVVGLGSGFAKRTRVWAVAGAVELALALALLFVLTPRLGVLGAGLARFGAAFIGFILCYVLTLKVFPTRLPVASIATATVLGLGATLWLATPLAGSIHGLPARVLALVAAIPALALVLLRTPHGSPRVPR